MVEDLRGGEDRYYGEEEETEDIARKEVHVAGKGENRWISKLMAVLLMSFDSRTGQLGGS